MLNICNNRYTKLEELTVLNAAPVIRGVKPSGLLCLACPIDASVYRQWKESLAPHIRAYPLYSCKGKPVMLLYREAGLRRVLKGRRAKSVLSAAGYPESTDIKSYLVELKRRFGEYIKGRGEFPHEVGIFLGYPPDDVQDYICNGGKSCLLTRYWKVYNKPCKAYRTFRLYDKAKSEAYSEYAAGAGIQSITRTDYLCAR